MKFPQIIIQHTEDLAHVCWVDMQLTAKKYLLTVKLHKSQHKTHLLHQSIS